jgi:YidC/Oxa1 family membrane protein insertase
MNPGKITKWLLVCLLLVVLGTQLQRSFSPARTGERQPLWTVDDQTAPPAESRAPEQICTLAGPRFRAELSTRGASLRHLYLTDHRFDGDGGPLDLVTTSRESRMPLRTSLRLPSGGAQQVPYDDLDWQLAGSDGRRCTFRYGDAITSLRKTVALTGEPYQLSVDVEVRNLDRAPRVHRFTLEQTDFRTKKEMESHLGRRSPAVTEVVLVTTQKTSRLGPTDFSPRAFSGAEFTPERWRRAPGEARVAAVSSVYFTKLAVPLEGPGSPVAEGQIEEAWDATRYPSKESDPGFGYVYRARVAYPAEELSPGGEARYHALSFIGPKERDLLAALGHGAPAVVDLGTFSIVARALLVVLRGIYRVVGSWGWAIVLLTVSMRVLLFPLSLSQIKNAAAMRRLKPEMDAIQQRYQKDASQRALAIQELWRKNEVKNPALGCLPMLLQLPIWWALYAALQSAVELYHVPFGPFIPDLTAPGRYFIIPVVLGAASYLQQRLMPAQGDPAQQRMLLYLMPAVFTVMMLFLPAGLGVYMLTSSLLAVAQQVVVARWLERRAVD